MVNYNRGVFGEAPGERVSQVASPSFDAMVSEVWPCLLSGAALYIADNEVRSNPADLKNWLIREGITISFQPTIIAEELLEEEWPEHGVCLRVLRTAGDRLKKYPVRSYPFRFYNLYGPTEDTVWTTWTEVEVKVKLDEGTTKYPTIGKPIDNHRVYILSTDLRLQPIGVSGELCIAGEGLSVGYLNNPELTAEKFVSVSYRSYRSYRSYISKKIYKTGDLARWLPDGNIEFLGRLDHQVKVRGYRIELGEIENSLMALAGIKEAVVITRSGENDETYLCAYVVTKNEPDIDGSLLRQELSTRLPDFMIPSRFMEIDKIPLTPNNKVDHKALPDPELTPLQLESGYLAPATEMEKLIADTWQEVLNLDKIGINNNFFNLGGNSLSLVKVIVKLRRVLKREIPTIMMLQYPTVHLLAQHLMEEEKQNKISAAEKKDQLEKLDKGKERLKATRKKMK
jgi:acyl-coenzyme A synthetase/AMP-(fatty) acid ligase/acyl carrier protein